MNIDNLGLEKFEVKKPDYDLIDRAYSDSLLKILQPLRYTAKNGEWVRNRGIRSFFGKKSIRIMFVGDITCFGRQIEEAEIENGYDFNYQFEQVKPIFEQADLVVGNLETTVFPEAPYRTEKLVSEQNFHCNGPIEFLDAVRSSGIDVVTTANNHDLDTGAVGIGETIDHINRRGLVQTGTFKIDKKRYLLMDVHGFKVAITAFATEHNNKRCNLTKEGAEFLLNDYSLENAGRIIRQAREDNAELVFCCIHWGKEHKTVHNDKQAEVARELAELGYDGIIGSHPHVLQPFTYLDMKDRRIPVFYSMGNFLSHNVNNLKARSIIACLDLTRRDGKIDIACSYIPIYTSKDHGRKKYVVLPIPEKPLDPRNIRKAEQIAQVVGDEIRVNRSVSRSECIERPSFALPTRKKTKPNLALANEFPVSYDDGKFVYSAFEDHVRIDGISPECTIVSHSVSSLVLELPVTEMVPGVFAGNTDIKKINFCKELLKIPVSAMKNCTRLEGFQLGSKIAEIEEEAFAGCTSLSAAVMVKKVEKIGRRAFINCVNLRSVKLSSKVKEISDDAFEGCPKAVFYCEENSYAQRYAQSHGFPVVVMEFD